MSTLKAACAYLATMLVFACAWGISEAQLSDGNEARNKAISNGRTNACVATVAPHERDTVLKERGWPLTNDLSAEQAAATLGITASEAATIKSPLSLDCSIPDQMPRAVLFTPQPNGRWTVLVYS